MPDTIETPAPDRLAGAMATIGTLQRKLDAALQKHQDDAADYAGKVAKLTDAYQERLTGLETAHAAALVTIQHNHAGAIAAIRAQAEAEILRYKVEIEAKLADLRTKAP
jgi:tRNA (Thr-GGU) A37 N-methylase